MVYLLKYEWHKFIRTKKNWLVFLLILCSFIGYVSFNGYQNHVYIEAKTEQFSKARQNAMYDITNMASQTFVQFFLAISFLPRTASYNSV